jgi:Tfp pilus assembly protein PilN
MMAKTIIVVHLGENCLTAVEVKANQGSAEMLRYIVQKFPESGFSSEWLQDVWKKEYFSHNRVIALLPLNLAKYKTLTLPKLPDEQIQAGVKLEMENTDPEAVYRIISIQKGAENTLVKLALVKDADLGSYLDRFSAAGFFVNWAGLNHHGIQNYLGFNLDFFEGSGADLYLSVHNSCSEFGALTNDELLFRRNLLIGGDDLATAPSKCLAELVEELRLSLASYRTTNNMPVPERIWLFGEVGIKPEWVDHLSAAFGIRFQVSDQNRLSGVITGKYTAELASLVGLALDDVWLSRKDWRFITMEQSLREANHRKLLTGVKTGLATLMLLGGILLGAQAKAVREEKNAAWLNEQQESVAQLRRDENEANRKIEQIKTLEEWLGNRGRELEFLRVLEASLPEQTQIKDIIIEDGIIKSLSGTTRSVSTLLEKLQHTPELKTFRLKGTITTDKNGMELFQLEGKFFPGEKTP